MINGELLALIPALAENTKNGQITWKLANNRTAFISNFGEYSVVVDYQDNAGPISPIAFGLLNNKLEFIEKIEINSLTNPKEFRLILNLYQQAKNSATDIGKAILSIKSKLKLE
ncbi:hypothetical protein [Geothrix paludis]|uniref:hypothetical protein n=1 Tax=Geothrix paludis TaxID=2922722 RepID=UPI001FAE1641|nr:hypothetical protein [Geothrix paludis]